MTGPADDDLLPVSVRLGAVVPPEDPEDWTRPLTWIAALGMLAGPLLTLCWFLLSPPSDGARATGPTLLAAATLAGGAAATGATQIGAVRASTATVAAGLFAALVMVILGVVLAGERQIGSASPTLAHAVAAAVAGLAGSLVASAVAAVVARVRARAVRFAAALATGVAVALVAVGALMA